MNVPSHSILAAMSLLPALVSCESMNRMVKPKAAAATPFLTHAAEMKAQPGRSPFLRNWMNPSPQARAVFEKKNELHIAVVTLDHLRPMSKVLAKTESGRESWLEGALKLGDYAKEEFSAAFRNSKDARFKIVDKPGRHSLTLELAFVELNPNSVSGALIKTAVNSVALPSTDLILAGPSRPLKGNIAIEGRLRDSRSKTSIFEFADNEESKSPVILNIRDFKPYGQARLAIHEWALQFEQLMRTPDDAKVKDSSSVTWRLW